MALTEAIRRFSDNVRNRVRSQDLRNTGIYISLPVKKIDFGDRVRSQDAWNLYLQIW
jgi:hypothetical protein